MLQAGLLREVADLLTNGFLRANTSAAVAIGYRQVLDYLERPDPRWADVEPLKEFVRCFGSATRNYARSQIHWFMKDPSFLWLEAKPGNPDAVAAELSRLIDLEPESFAQALLGDKVLRENQAKQGSAMALDFTSSLERGLPMAAEELTTLLREADECTAKIPEQYRRQSDPGPVLLEIPLDDASAARFGKVYWPGRHQLLGWGNPLGKLHRQGLQLLEPFGWRSISESENIVPAFAWPTRKAADFPATSSAGTLLPLIRPFPQDFTALLDDKLQLAEHLTAGGYNEIHPETWPADEFLVAPPPEVIGDDVSMWFIKHKLGVKGNSVHVFRGRAAVLQRLSAMGPSCKGFIVQRCVEPVAVRNGRKWVLRVHSLLHGLPNGELRLYCHREMIVLEYGQLFSESTAIRSAHVSNVGNMKHLPKPTLLDDEALAEQVRRLTIKTFESVMSHAPRGPYAPPTAELCQVFGLDVIVDSFGKPWLLEVNSYPAIASGTMDHVDKTVYTNLVRDVLKLVVLPKLNGLAPTVGGWQRLEAA